MHSDNNSSTKIFLNSVTGMTAASGYINYQNNVVVPQNMIKQHPVSHREEKAGTATTLYAMPPGAVDHDPYMSFIDSDKFSPIQSVSGEEIDEDDSLD